MHFPVLLDFKAKVLCENNLPLKAAWGMRNTLFFHYTTRRDSIKPSLQFSVFDLFGIFKGSSIQNVV